MDSQQDLIFRRWKNGKPGYQLAASVPFGLPVREYPLKVQVFSQTNYPLTREYLLKCVHASIATVPEVSGFLGIEQEIVGNAVAEEMAAGNLAYDAAGKLSLTSRGEAALVSLQFGKLELTAVTAQVDEMTGELVSYRPIGRDTDFPTMTRGAMPSPSEVKFWQPKRPSRPSPSFFNVQALNTLLNMDTQRIVEVTGHKGKRSERKFKPSWLLVYVGIGQQDTVCEILIDGTISDPHHQFVNQSDFLTVLGIEVEPLVEAPSALEALRDLELVNSPRINELIEIAREIPFDDEAQEVELSDEDEGELRISPASANFRRVGLGMFLNERQSPSLVSVYEHGKLLQEALTCASKRLLIVSPWIKANVVDKRFIENIERLLKREVDVTIVYGYEDGDGNHSSAINALCALVPLGLKFLRHENTHAKVLVVDNCAIMTSFNWLSFKGDPARTYRMEEGMEYRSEAWCNVLLETLNDKFSREASPACH